MKIKELYTLRIVPHRRVCEAKAQALSPTLTILPQTPCVLDVAETYTVIDPEIMSLRI